MLYRRALLLGFTQLMLHLGDQLASFTQLALCPQPQFQLFFQLQLQAFQWIVIF